MREPDVRPTDEEWLEHLFGLPRAMQLETVKMIRESQVAAQRCFIENHTGRLHVLEHAFADTHADDLPTS